MLPCVMQEWVYSMDIMPFFVFDENNTLLYNNFSSHFFDLFFVLLFQNYFNFVVIGYKI